MRLGRTHILIEGNHVVSLQLDQLPAIGEWITWPGAPPRGAEVVKVLRDYRGAQELRCGDGEVVHEYDGFLSVKVLP